HICSGNLECNFSNLAPKPNRDAGRRGERRQYRRRTRESHPIPKCLRRQCQGHDRHPGALSNADANVREPQLMTRVGTLAENTQILGYLQQNKTFADQLTQQIATGLKAQNYSGLAPQAAQLVSLQDQQSREESYINTINKVSTKLNVMSLSIGGV